jgi:MFS family permease
MIDLRSPNRSDAGLDGKRGWTVVAAAFSATGLVFGITYSFGVLFDALAAEFGTGRGATAAVFSLLIAVLFLLGLVTGPAADRYGARPLLLAGATVMSAGLLLTARTENLWLGYLGFGLGVGLGAACTYIPLVVTVSGWFERQRSLAVAVTVSGIGLGTLAGAPLTAWLLDQLGFRATCLVFSAATAVVLPLCSLGVRRPPRPADAAPLAFRQIARRPGFGRLYASAALLMAAISTPFVFFAPYARQHGLSPLEAAWLVGLMGAASIPGRLALAAIGPRWGAQRMYRACFGLVPLSLLIWLLADGRPAWLAAFAALFGVAYGGWIALSPVVVDRLYGSAGLGRVLGLLYTSAALGVLAWPPLTGLLIDLTDAFTPAILLCTAVAGAAWLVLGKLEARPAASRVSPRAAVSPHAPPPAVAQRRAA